MSASRDIELISALPGARRSLASRGRNVVAVIGIDGYQHWQRLSNAVCDARGTAALFERLGFVQVTEPLLDDRATGRAIQSLVTDDLKALGPEDSLVVFYAGHGGNQQHRLGDRVVKTGYLIPVDAQDKVATWIDLEGWLRAVSVLPAKHILVVLDACHSGIALDPIVRWRDSGVGPDESLTTLSLRRSRRIITSALDDQVACDSGPMRGHSLFTGCLLEGLTHGIHRGSRVITGSELGLYLQRRVEAYPESRQTPDFGTFGFHERGEMVISLVIEPTEAPGNSRPEIPVMPAPDPSPAPATAVARPTPVPVAGPASSPLIVTDAPSFAPAPARDPAVRRRARLWLAAGASLSALAGGSFAVLSSRADGPPSAGQPAAGHPAAGTPTLLAVEPLDAAVADASSRAAASGPVAREHAAPLDAAAVDVSSRAAASGRVAGEHAAPPRRVASLLAGRCRPGMVPVPAATFWMGSPDGAGDADEHPIHQVTLSAYCIDRTEVTVASYAACVEAGACPTAPLTVHWDGLSEDDARRYSQFCNDAERPDHPINCVDWHQAAAYCKWAGGRLPTEAEWEYAARGPDGRTYPWGDEAPGPKRLNACGPECVAALRDVIPSRGKMYDTSDGWAMTAPVGSFPAGESPFGALDMAGNVCEWTADWYGAYSAAARTNPRGPRAGSARVGRGGGWSGFRPGGARTTDRDRSDPSTRLNNVGFRCARRG